MRHWIFLLLLCQSSVAVSEEPRRLPVDESAIVAEMEALIDASGEPSAKDAKRAGDLVLKGVKAHDAQDYERAIELYREALVVYPVQAVAYYELAYSHSSLGRQIEALDAIFRALTINPKNEHYYVLKGNVLDDLGYTDEALRTYEQLLEVQPESFLGHLNFGITLVRAREYDRADVALLRALEIQPKHPSPYFHLALLSNTRGFDYDERRYLEGFLEIAGDDPRRAEVEHSLERLSSHDWVVDPNQPYSEIRMMESMEHLLWRTTKHRKVFPEARGYSPSFEEDKSVSAAVLSMWREEKANDPAAHDEQFDLLMQIDDAGFLDEYLWYQKQSLLGERGSAWIMENSERIEAFLAWAESENLLPSEEEPSGEESRLAYERELPFKLMQLLADSSVTYSIESGEARKDGLLTAEKRRYARIKLTGDDRVKCRDPGPTTLDGGTGSMILPMFRCLLPEDPLYAEVAPLASRLGLRTSEIVFAPLGDLVFKEDDSVDALFEDPAWLIYGLAKAAWRMEPELRSANGGATDDKKPSIEEELYALSAAAGAYLNSLEPEQEPGDEPQEPVQQIPALERLIEAIETGDLRGFALLEVMHQTYGMSLERMSRTDADSIENYLFRHVLKRIVP